MSQQLEFLNLMSYRSCGSLTLDAPSAAERARQSRMKREG
jgi:hypothetical protein